MFRKIAKIALQSHFMAQFFKKNSKKFGTLKIMPTFAIPKQNQTRK